MHRVFGRAGSRTAAALLLVGLLLVPMLLRGHHADHGSSSRPCAVCVVAHSPVVQATSPVASEPLLQRVASAPAMVARPAQRARSAESVRGPPSFPRIPIV
jgi:hypothetical protein